MQTKGEGGSELSGGSGDRKKDGSPKITVGLGNSLNIGVKKKEAKDDARCHDTARKCHNKDNSTNCQNTERTPQTQQFKQDEETEE